MDEPFNWNSIQSRKAQLLPASTANNTQQLTFSSKVALLPEEILRCHILALVPLDFLSVAKKIREEAIQHLFNDNRMKLKMILNAAQSAAYYGDLALIKKIKSFPLDLTARDNKILRIAMQGGHLDMIKYLVECGADPTVRERLMKKRQTESKFDFNCSSHSAIDTACSNDTYKNIFDYFASFGPKFAFEILLAGITHSKIKFVEEVVDNPDKYDTQWKTNAVEIIKEAISHQNSEILLYLLDRMQLTEQEASGVLDFASKRTDYEWAMPHLLKKLDFVNDDHLALAMFGLSTEEVKNLFKRTHPKGPPNSILLAGAIKSSKIDLVRYFLDFPGWTPVCPTGISSAVEAKRDNIEMVDLLVSHKINNTQDVLLAIKTGFERRTIQDPEFTTKLLDLAQKEASRVYLKSILDIVIWSAPESVVLAILNHPWTEEKLISADYTALLINIQANIPNVITLLKSRVK